MSYTVIDAAVDAYFDQMKANNAYDDGEWTDPLDAALGVLSGSVTDEMKEAASRALAGGKDLRAALAACLPPEGV